MVPPLVVSGSNSHHALISVCTCIVTAEEPFINHQSLQSTTYCPALPLVLLLALNASRWSCTTIWWQRSLQAAPPTQTTDINHSAATCFNDKCGRDRRIIGRQTSWFCHTMAVAPSKPSPPTGATVQCDIICVDPDEHSVQSCCQPHSESWQVYLLLPQQQIDFKMESSAVHKLDDLCCSPQWLRLWQVVPCGMFNTTTT